MAGWLKETLHGLCSGSGLGCDKEIGTSLRPAADQAVPHNNSSSLRTDESPLPYCAILPGRLNDSEGLSSLLVMKKQCLTR